MPNSQLTGLCDARRIKSISNDSFKNNLKESELVRLRISDRTRLSISIGIAVTVVIGIILAGLFS